MDSQDQPLPGSPFNRDADSSRCGVEMTFDRAEFWRSCSRDTAAPAEATKAQPTRADARRVRTRNLGRACSVILGLFFYRVWLASLYV
jgi:hypothetical protein